jgi:hypothetical protein
MYLYKIFNKNVTKTKVFHFCYENYFGGIAYILKISINSPLFPLYNLLEGKKIPLYSKKGIFGVWGPVGGCKNQFLNPSF